MSSTKSCQESSVSLFKCDNMTSRSSSPRSCSSMSMTNPFDNDIFSEETLRNISPFSNPFFSDPFDPNAIQFQYPNFNSHSNYQSSSQTSSQCQSPVPPPRPPPRNDSPSVQYAPVPKPRTISLLNKHLTPTPPLQAITNHNQNDFSCQNDQDKVSASPPSPSSPPPPLPNPQRKTQRTNCISSFPPPIPARLPNNNIINTKANNLIESQLSNSRPNLLLNCQSDSHSSNNQFELMNNHQMINQINNQHTKDDEISPPERNIFLKAKQSDPFDDPFFN